MPVIRKHQIFLSILLLCNFGSLSFANAGEKKNVCETKCKIECLANCMDACIKMCEANKKVYDSMSPFEKRTYNERKIRNAPFVLIPYKPNYLLASWDDTLDEQDEANEPYETKFQLSFKIPLTAPDREWTLYFGYTQLSVWQMANTAHSSPFRDNNYEPEVMLYYVPEQALIGGIKLRLINFGIFNHQSNGQSGEKSRSWNRSYIETVFEIDRHYIGLKAWHRWKERQKNGPNDPEGDDNPDIDEFIGHGEIKYLYAGEEHNFGITVRDNFHYNEHSYGSFQIDYTFPVDLFNKQGLRVYVQYFNGYGETLIDYNKKRERIGMGVILADWL